jgi:hypothetical protein
MRSSLVDTGESEAARTRLFSHTGPPHFNQTAAGTIRGSADGAVYPFNERDEIQRRARCQPSPAETVSVGA